MATQPILASSCAQATTAREARYRIDAPIAGRRGARIVALDDRAATIVRRAAQQPWNGARFFTLEVGAPGAQGPAALLPDGDGSPDIALHRTDGSSSRLTDELSEADVAIMVATTDGNAEAAEAIGRACARRGIMTAGLALGERRAVAGTILALRPHAQVLLVSGDDEDLAEVLTALRA
jgi:hypothetical protein